MIYFLITIILDFVFSLFISSTYQDISIFFPVLFIASVPVLYHLLNNKKLFLFLLVIIGIIYDFLFSDIFLVNSYYFILYGLFVYSYYQNHYLGIINIILISILGVVCYDVFVFFILVLTKYSVFDINELYYKVSRSLFISFVYVVLSIIALKSRIFGHRKRRKRVKNNIFIHNMF